MAEGTGSDSARRWRDKYLDLLDSHEKLKNSSELQHDQMRRGLVMVSLLAEGQAAGVDKSLNDLREALKPGASGMNRVMDELERAVKRFEEQNTAQAEVLLGQLSDTADKLSLCPLPKPLLKRIKDIRKGAANELLSWSGYINQLQSWIQILGEIATLEGFEEQRNSKWWQRWFKPSDTESDEETADDSAEHDDQPEAEPGFSHIAQEVSETLLNLLSQLVIPDRLNHTALNLQNRLQEGLNWYELVPLLEDTTDFLLECLGNSQTELEQFLQSLDQRLKAIQVLVSEASQGQLERKRARLDLDSMVRDQIADIRSVVTGSGDLGELGVSVRDHLTMIVQAMEKYQKEEEEREERLAARLEMLQARLSEMEKEVTESRVAIEEQKRRATHDNLTGLPNRDAYQARLADELLRRNRYGGSLALVVGDVDHFKRINDNYGHLAGDKVLQLIARSLRKNLRDVDFIARYGGEEFVILMPETNTADAMIAAEKLRAKIENSPFNFKKERVPITMSFGVSEFHALESPDAVFDRADKALYQAKKEGRNRICQG
ncbi:GGDEF domain-containing protein [Thalassolituus hydrocarboniclasticus]|uniref:diguanylate cyclase n=1 Tax=Thalassolituus hydrocarboniclasticus TaxID=2742796 RepID=A0ABY6ADR1_9GAMM|nr:GGDEF domain-containing protein [Thalassolituus hydrocarboniclasticus]UXD89176.1 GGDEF domain-containing protein [Thalassolituus hydrocarboniclasticus]